MLLDKLIDHGALDWLLKGLNHAAVIDLVYSWLVYVGRDCCDYHSHSSRHLGRLEILSVLASKSAFVSKAVHDFDGRADAIEHRHDQVHQNETIPHIAALLGTIPAEELNCFDSVVGLVGEDIVVGLEQHVQG